MTENIDDPFGVLSASSAGRANRGRRLLRIPRSAVTAVSRTCPPGVNALQDTLTSEGRARESMPHRTSSLSGKWEVYRAREGQHQALQPTRAFIKCIPDYTLFQFLHLIKIKSEYISSGNTFF